MARVLWFRPLTKLFDLLFLRSTAGRIADASPYLDRLLVELAFTELELKPIRRGGIEDLIRRADMIDEVLTTDGEVIH